MKLSFKLLVKVGGMRVPQPRIHNEKEAKPEETEKEIKYL